MAQTIKHAKTSVVPDGSDVNQVQPTDWNASHTITGTVDYSELSGKPATFPPTLPIAESDVTNLVSDLALKSPLASPTFTGDPKAPTPTTADSDTSIATTAHVHAAIAADVVRATTTEVLTGTDTAKAVTPDALAALWRLGTAVPAAPTLVLGDGGVFVISPGTGPITDIDFGVASRNGRAAWLIFNTAVTLTHSATLNLVGAADITTVSQDMALVIQEAGDSVRMLSYQRANGGVLGLSLATTTEVLTGTDAVKVVSPDALAALWEYGGAVAAASNTVLGEGAYFYITGTGVTINDFTFATSKIGRTALVEIGGGSHTLVHSATLDLPGAANITALPGDRMLIAVTGASLRKVVFYQRADGTIFPGNAATTTEVLAGTNTTKAVTPDALAALWERGTDVASATTTVLGDGGYFSITGTVTITAFDFATVSKTGRTFSCRFTGILILTNSATLILPGAVNITTAAGDMATFVQSGTGSPDTFICLSYTRANGTTIVNELVGLNAPTYTDLNSVPNGFQHIRAGTPFTNSPIANNCAGFQTGHSSGAKTQIMFNPDNTAVRGWMRNYASAAWNAWREIAPLDDPTFTGVVAAPTINLTGGQIAFPAAQNASAGANTLDDYEEGTFTPGLTFGGAAVGLTSSTAIGWYTKVGRAVHFNSRFILSAKGTSTGSAVVTGLPFASAAAMNYAVTMWTHIPASTVGDTFLEAYIQATTVNIIPAKMAAGITTQLTDADFGNTTQLMFSGSYQV